MHDNDMCLIVWLKMWNEIPAHITPSVWHIIGTPGKQKIKCFLIFWPFEHKSTGKWLREHVPTFWETSRGVLSLGYTSVPKLGPVVYKPTKVMIFSHNIWYIWPKKKKKNAKWTSPDFPLEFRFSLSFSQSRALVLSLKSTPAITLPTKKQDCHFWNCRNISFGNTCCFVKIYSVCRKRS